LNSVKELAEAFPSNLPKITPEQARNINNEHKRIPSEYIEFLLVIGYGDLGNFQIYSGPVSMEEIYSGSHSSNDKYLVVGDDQLGYCFAIDIEGGARIVEIEPDGNVSGVVARTFLELVGSFSEH